MATTGEIERGEDAGNDSRVNSLLWWRAVLLLLLLVLGLFSTYFVWRTMEKSQHEVLVARFAADAATRAETVERLLRADFDILYAVQAFYMASNEVERYEFRNFTTPLLERHPRLMAVEWVRRVPHAQRAEFEAVLRADTPNEQGIVDQTSPTQRSPAAAREEYFAVEFAEPIGASVEMIGYDHGAVPARRDAMRLAAQRNEITAAARQQLWRAGPNTLGVVFYLPIYRRDVPVNTPERREASLLGFVAGIFELSGVLAHGLAEHRRAPIFVELVDFSAPEGEQCLYHNDDQAHDEIDLKALGVHGLVYQEQFDIGGRTWGTIAAPTQAYIDRHRSALPLVALVGGLMLTCVVTGYVMSLSRRTTVVERMISERTEQLEASNVSLQHEVNRRIDAETALRETDERLQMALRAAGFGTWAWDVREDRSIWDAYTHNLYGIPAGQEPSNLAEALELIHPDDRAVVQQVLAAAMESDKYDSVEFRVVWPDGSMHHLRARGKVIRDESGEPVRLTGVIWDVTDQKSAERRLQQFAAELARSNQELEQFAYVASHDLQEPLRKIQAFGDLLTRQYHDALDEEGRDYLARMQNASQRMQDLVHDLLSLSRVTSRARDFEPTDLNQVVGEVLSDLETRIAETRGDVVVGDLPRIVAEPTQMRQLFQNLIGNALKYRRPEVPPRVDVRAASESAGEAFAEIHVCDNGIGFESKQAERIFSPFQRLHGRGEYEGTGIGLALCRKIVERHGGTIRAEGSPGEGSRFIIRLPAVQPEAGTVV